MRWMGICYLFTGWLQVSGVTHSDLVDAIVATFSGDELGRKALADAGRKNPGVFLSPEATKEILADMDRIRRKLLRPAG